MHFDKRVCAAAILMAVVGNAGASGFALLEQNASGMGNAYAGGAAVAEDASTIFFNPAGLSRLSGKQLVLAAHAIRPSAKFTGTGAAGTDMGGDAGSWVAVPNGYFAVGGDTGWSYGLGVEVPFGLQTEYSPAWVGRAHAIKSRLETINLNPSVAYRVNDSLSLGAGLDYQQIKGELTANPFATSISRMTGSDRAWGYNLGALIDAGEATRFGLAYRSGISYNLSGRVDFTGPLAALSGPASLAVKMPAMLSASVFQKLDTKWDVMADVSWTGWSTFKELRVVRPNGAVVQLVPENWRDTLRASLGTSHHYNEQWTARAGLAYDQAPVSTAYRTARIPDADRFEIALGGQYKTGPDSALDFGYAHLFVNNAAINSTVAAPALSGTYKNSADVLSIQYTLSFH